MPQYEPVARETSAHESWLRLFDDYDVQYVILDLHADSELQRLLQSQSAWSVDFQDEKVAIYARAEAAQSVATAPGCTMVPGAQVEKRA